MVTMAAGLVQHVRGGRVVVVVRVIASGRGRCVPRGHLLGHVHSVVGRHRGRLAALERGGARRGHGHRGDDHGHGGDDGGGRGGGGAAADRLLLQLAAMIVITLAVAAAVTPRVGRHRDRGDGDYRVMPRDKVVRSKRRATLYKTIWVRR